jgi:hypothetical protein
MPRMRHVAALARLPLLLLFTPIACLVQPACLYVVCLSVLQQWAAAVLIEQFHFDPSKGPLREDVRNMHEA